MRLLHVRGHPLRHQLLVRVPGWLLLGLGTPGGRHGVHERRVRPEVVRGLKVVVVDTTLELFPAVVGVLGRIGRRLVV